ncbi:MAG: hypothetical protein QG646_3254 [Euryarchaeota archaeon]|nr:hypothetical protein [Euryarchaeota archaeon]
MKSLLPFLLLLIFLISPANAETIYLPNSAGSDVYKIINENYGANDLIEIGGTSSIGVDYLSFEEDTYIAANYDTINQISFEMSVDSSTGNETIPFTLSNGETSQDFVIQINRTQALGLAEINCSLYTADGDYLCSDIGYSLFYEYFQVVFNRFGYGISNNNMDYGLMPIYEDPTYNNLIPAKSLTIDLSDTGASVLCRIEVYDNQEYAEEQDSSFIMGVYWVIESVIGDPDNVLYSYFQIADLYFSWVTWVIVIMVTAPFMYVMFAGICGLAAACLAGNFRSGFSAGMRTFVKVMMIPVNIIKMLANMVYGIIEILKPTG